EIHDLANLQRIGFAQRAAEDGEILRENINETAVDSAISGDYAIARVLLLLHSEIEAAMRDESVEFFERILVEQQGDTLARCQLPFCLLAIEPLFAAAKLGRAI